MTARRGRAGFSGVRAGLIGPAASAAPKAPRPSRAHLSPSAARAFCLEAGKVGRRLVDDLIDVTGSLLKITLLAAVGFVGLIAYVLALEDGRAQPQPPAAEIDLASATDNRASCQEIRGTEYESAQEREWFLEHCTAAAAQPPAAAGCPVDRAVCEFAERLDARLAAGAYLAIVSTSRFQPFECAGDEVGPSSALQLCRGARGGEVRQGLNLFRRYTDGDVVSPTQLMDYLKLTLSSAAVGSPDRFGPGAYTLHSVGCGPRPGTVVHPSGPSCQDSFAVVFSGLTTLWHEPRLNREALVFFVDGTSATPEIYAVGSGVISSVEADTVLRLGGSVPDLGRVYPLR